MILLLVIFTVSVGGMIAIPLRHYPRVRAGEDGAETESDNSVVRAHAHQWVVRMERWYQETAKNIFLKTLDVTLRFLERGAGRLAGSMKEWRMMVQERFRVIPRESLYWKNIHSWKKTNGAAFRSELWEDEQDISNHVER